MNAHHVFRNLWNAVPIVEEDEAACEMKNILEKRGFFILKNYEELESKARSELNMVNQDDVRTIASEEYGMIDGPGEER